MCLLLPPSILAVGESAVITLVFPPGARATGLGEAFTGLANDANATFFNPAGLGQAPLSYSWQKFQEEFSDVIPQHVAARSKNDYFAKEEVWVGTDQGIYYYNGSVWQNYQELTIEHEESLEQIVRSILDTDDEEKIAATTFEVMSYNDFQMKRYNALVSLLQQSPSLTAEAAREISKQIVLLSAFERTQSRIFGIIASAGDTVQTQTLAERADSIMQIEDKSFDLALSLKIPFSLTFKDSVTAMLLDKSNKLWIGTTSGLWQLDGIQRKKFTTIDGLPSNSITALSMNEYFDLAVGTDNGPVLFSESTWDSLPQLPLTDTQKARVNAIAITKSDQIYVGTNNGLYLKSEQDSTWRYFDTTNGLISNTITALAMDENNRLWVGGADGICILDNTTWKRYKFPNSTVRSIAHYDKNKSWIATNRGVVVYQRGKTVTSPDGQIQQEPPTWKSYHSKNALVADDITSISTHGSDVWLASANGVNQWDYAERQVQFFYEPLLPEFNLPQLWHTYFAGIYPTDDWGTFGLHINYINMGVNEWTDELGRQIGAEQRSWEGVFGLSYGLNLSRDMSIGLNFQYVHSALAPGIGDEGEGVGRTFAIDVGFLKRNFIIPKLSWGIMAQNMGPAIYYRQETNKDPIPFTIRTGVAYQPVKDATHELNLLFDMDREFVKNYFDGNPDPFYRAIFTTFQRDSLDSAEGFEYFTDQMTEIQLHGGVEYWYVQFLAVRAGMLFDWVGERYELTLGIGIKYGKNSFDWSYIHSPSGFMKGFVKLLDSNRTGATGARQGQWRTSMIFRF